MADLEVDITEMSALEKKLESAIETLHENLGNLYTSVNELNGTWEGPNHDTFVENFENRYLNMEELEKGLKSYLKALKKARKSYTQCEEDVLQIVRSQ